MPISKKHEVLKCNCYCLSLFSSASGIPLRFPYISICLKFFNFLRYAFEKQVFVTFEWLLIKMCMISMIYNVLYSIKHNIYCPKETYIGKPICHWMHVSQTTCMKTWYIDTKYSKIILVVLEAQGRSVPCLKKKYMIHFTFRYRSASLCAWCVRIFRTTKNRYAVGAFASQSQDQKH